MTSPERQAELIDKYRRVLVEDYHWEADVRDAFNDMLFQRCGLRAAYLTYDIDGGWAHFNTRTIWLSEFLRKASLNTQYPEWEIRDGHIGVVSQSSLRNDFGVIITKNNDCSGTYNDTYENFDEFKIAVEEAIFNKTEETYDSMVNDIEIVVNEMCRELYYLLSEEYEYLTSDEVIWEHIVINKWHLEEQENEDNNESA
jgi:hypothetical protein